MGGGFAKLERKAGDFATVAACATLGLAEDGTIARSGIALTAVAETPFAATDAEAALAGQRPSEEAFRAAGLAAGAQSRPAADIRGPVEYKRAMAAEMVVRALRRGHPARPVVRLRRRPVDDHPARLGDRQR